MKNPSSNSPELSPKEMQRVQGGAEAFPVADRDRWMKRDAGSKTVEDDPVASDGSGPSIGEATPLDDPSYQ